MAGLLASDPGPLEAPPPGTGSSYILERTASAGWIFKYNGKHLLSSYDPEKEAERLASAVKLNPDANFVFFGSGLGFFIRKVLGRSLPAAGRPRPVVLILEEDPEIAVKSLEAPGMDVLKRFETHLLLRSEKLFDFNIDRSFIPLAFNTMLLTEIGFYRNAYSLMRLISANNSTKHKFRRLILRNSARNIRQMPVSLPRPDMKGAAGVVVAAGPSLEKDLPDLKKIRDRCIIASSDTTLPLLLKSGISPHFVVTGDPQVVSYSHFYLCRKGLQASGRVRLVSDITASPLIMPLFGRRHVYINTGSPLSDMLAERPPLVRMGGSITAGAFFFLLGLGIRKIYFTGQDYGSLFDQTHCRATIYDHYIHRMNTRLMPVSSRQVRMHYPGSVRFATDAGPVWTTPLLVSYCEWLKSEVEKLDDVEVVNTSRRSLFKSSRIRQGSFKELENSVPVGNAVITDSGDVPGITASLASLLDEIGDASRMMMKIPVDAGNRRPSLLRAFRSNSRLVSLFGWFYKGRERYFDLERYGSERFDENIRLLLDLCRDLT